MINDRYTVISSDCHAGLLPEMYRGYVDPQYREAFDMALPMQTAITEKFESMFLVKEANEKWRSGVEDALSGAWDYQRRLEVLDGDGIAGEIIFPDGITEQNAPPFGAGLALPTEGIMPDLQWAGARAHNRWLAELCARDPVRHFGVAVCPLLWDIDRAVEEVRFGAENGLGGMLIPLLLTDAFEPYHHPRYNPFWEACEDAGIVVCFHSGPGPFSHFFGKGFPDNDQSKYPGALGTYISEVFFWTWRPLIFMLWGGVFERYPRLRASVTETGQGWMLPPLFRMLDHHYNDTFFSAKLGDYRSHLSMAPTDYFRRNCAIGASCMPRSDAEIRHQLGMDQIMWGTDYPHPEGTWPHTRPQMIDTFKGLPEDDIAAMLGGNAAAFYRFDLAELDKVGARVGPERMSFAA